jgi:uncharacterized repeat protein (TIGR01451 family)
MSFHLQRQQVSARISSKENRSKLYYHCSLAIILGIINQNVFWMPEVLAQTLSVGDSITNQATGSFVDFANSSATTNIESNIVSVTISEVAGITISNPIVIEPSATTIGAAAAQFQGVAGVNTDDILYFDFVITNIGNDPTQFFIPGKPFQVDGGTQYSEIQIIEVKNALGTTIPLPGNVAKIDLPATGANTGDTTVLGIPGGSIPASGSVKVRIPIKVTGGSGTSVKVLLGDTGPNDNGTGTVNKPYTASTTTPNTDVYTKDNSNNTSLNTPISGENNGMPNGGEKEASRFGLAPIIAKPQVIGFKSAKLTDSNADNKINSGETVTWTIDYVNTGTIDVPNFQITDVLPVDVTKSGSVTLIVGGSGQATPTINNSYTGTNTTPGTTDKLFTTAISLKAGGMIKVTIPVTINPGIMGTLFNQATATADNLPVIGIKTDNAGVTTDLPTNIQNPPYGIVIPSSSISQIITSSIDPTTITVEALPVAGSPNLLLVKRITAINGLPNKINGESLTSYEHVDAYDNNYIIIPTRPFPADPQKDTDKWPNTTSTSETATVSTFLIGASNGGTVKSKDSIEYTIYYLSTGDSEAKNVLLCDRVPDNVTFIPNAFNNILAGTGGLPTADRGIAIKTGINPIQSYTNTADGDLAQYFPAGVEPSTVYPNIRCSKPDPLNPTMQLPNNNGAVVVNLGNIPKADSSGNPSTSYGFIRFRGLVK